MPGANLFARNLASICRNILRDEKAPKTLLNRGRAVVVFSGDLLGALHGLRIFERLSGP